MVSSPQSTELAKRPTVTRRLGAVMGAYAQVARSPSYFPLWLGQLISNFGDTLHDIALVVLVFHLTGRGDAAPVLLLLPGAMRVDCRKQHVGSDPISVHHQSPRAHFAKT